MRRSNRPLTKTGEEGRKQIRLERKKINELNKSRAKAMERKIAEYFGEGGKRVPMSGAAGTWKGDVIVEFQNHPGKMLVECKLSAAYHNTADSPTLKLDFKWFPKIVEEVEITRATFGVLITHYHKTKDFYVFIRPQDLELLITKYQIEDQSLVLDMLAGPVVKDWSFTKGGKPLSAYNLTSKEAESILQTFSLYRAARVTTPMGDYIMLPLRDFRELIREL